MKNVCHWNNVNSAKLFYRQIHGNVEGWQWHRQDTLSTDFTDSLQDWALHMDLLPLWRQGGAKVLGRGFQLESPAFYSSFVLAAHLLYVTYKLFYCLNDTFLSVAL